MKKLKYSLLLVLATMIWGTAFVAQRHGADILDAYSFNSVRSFLGALALLPVYLVRRHQLRKSDSECKKNHDNEESDYSLPLLPFRIPKCVAGGFVCGLILAVSTLFQQVGLEDTTAGKAGFITALYILIVPILGVVLGKKVGLGVWCAVIIAIIGMYRLCVCDGLTIERGDRMVLCCALAFSFHILLIDYFVKHVDSVLLSMLQFVFCGIFSLIPFIWHAAPIPSLSQIAECWIPIVYTGIFSSGIAYTLQIVSQKQLQPTVASLLMSLESVFAALAGWLISDESLSTRELSGCALVFAAIIIAQLPCKTDKGSDCGS